MACSSCGQSLISANQIPPSYIPVQMSVPNCDYDLNQIIHWSVYLRCIKDAGTESNYGLDNTKLNSYLGIVLSAINMDKSLCYFKTQLDEMKPSIDNIVLQGAC